MRSEQIHALQLLKLSMVFGSFHGIRIFSILLIFIFGLLVNRDIFLLMSSIMELRKEKSRDAARSRRGKENYEFYELAKVI